METKFSLEVVLAALRPLFSASTWRALFQAIKKLLTSPVFWKMTGGLVLVVAISAGTAWIVGNARSQPPPPSPVSWERIGGVDLQRYCEAYSYGQSDMNVEDGRTLCSSAIDLHDACNWTYRSTGMTFKLKDPNNSRSGVCYDGEGKDKGGIDNMTGYCGSKGSTGEPFAIDPDGKWMCQLEVDMDVACGWQHNQNGVEARWDKGKRDWSCWRKLSDRSA